MSGNITKPERITQNRVVKLFEEQLDHTYLGNLQDKADNSNVSRAAQRAGHRLNRPFGRVLRNRLVVQVFLATYLEGFQCCSSATFGFYLLIFWSVSVSIVIEN